METVEGIGEKKRKEQRDSNAVEEVFCLWRFWIYYLLL